MSLEWTVQQRVSGRYKAASSIAGLFETAAKNDGRIRAAMTMPRHEFAARAALQPMRRGGECNLDHVLVPHSTAKLEASVCVTRRFR